MSGGIADGSQETSLSKPEFKGAEFAWQEGNNVGYFRWWNKEIIDAVDDTVSAKLCIVSSRAKLWILKPNLTILIATMRL